MDNLDVLAGRLPHGAVTTDAGFLPDRAIDSWALALLRRVRGDELPVPAAVVCWLVAGFPTFPKLADGLRAARRAET